MGNTCACSKQEEEGQQVLPSQATPRSKPEKLPVISQAVKSQSKRVNNERTLIVNNEQAHEEIKKFPFSGQRPQIKPVVRETQLLLPPSTNQVVKSCDEGNSNNLRRNSDMQNGAQPQQKEENKDPPKKNLYEKLGEMEGILTFVDKVLYKVNLEEDLNHFFADINPTLIREKFKQYVAYISGGQQLWIGQTMNKAHKHLKISDNQFDMFISCCVQSLKEMRVKHDCLKETVRLFQGLRDEIVSKQDENLQVPLYQTLGSQNGLKSIVDSLYQKVSKDENISYFFKQTLLDMQKTKMVYFLSSALGGPIVWVGQSMKQAHSGKVIQEGDFMAFVGHLYQTLEEMKVEKEVQMKVLDLINSLKPDIVDPPLPRTLYDMLNVKHEYLNAIHLFLEQTMNHFSLQSHFSKLSPQQKELIKSKFAQCFAYLAGAAFNTDESPLGEMFAGLGLKDEDFLIIMNIFKQTLLTFNFEDETIEQALQIMLELKGSIIDSKPQEQPPRKMQDLTDQYIQELNDEAQQNSVSSSPNRMFENDDQPNHSNRQSLVEDQQQKNIKESSYNKKYSIKHDTYQDQIPVMPVEKEGPIESQDKLVLPKNTHQNQHSYIPYKYILTELLTSQKETDSANYMVFEGELHRHMEKQRTQLPRWLVLNQKALLIFKDQLNAKSFPGKPLLVVPISEIKRVTTKEVMLYPNQRKSSALHALIIEMHDTYNNIARNIAQLLTGQKVFGNDHRYHSPLRDKSNRQQEQGQHPLDETFLSFVSPNKKVIIKWLKQLQLTLNHVPQLDLSTSKQSDKDKQTSLIDHLGGEETLDKVLEELTAQLAEEPQLQKYITQKDNLLQFLKHNAQSDVGSGPELPQDSVAKLLSLLMTILKEKNINEGVLQQLEARFSQLPQKQ